MKKTTRAYLVFTLLLPFGASADLIDNGTIGTGTGGGYCADCGLLDGNDFIYFDDFTLDSDSTLSQLDFEINLFQGQDTATANFVIYISDLTISTDFLTYNFVGSDALSATSIGNNGWSMSFLLDNSLLLAESYMLGIGADFGAFPDAVGGWIGGTDWDGQHNACQDVRPSGSSSHCDAGLRDLPSMPFRLYTNITAVPEPGTLALLGIGLAGMGLARRRRTQ